MMSADELSQLSLSCLMMLFSMDVWFLMEDLDDWPTLISRSSGESLVILFGSPETFLAQLHEMGRVEFQVE